MRATACSLDPIPTKLLKDVLGVINTHILKIINGSLSSSIVPSALKVAVVKPMLKKHNLDPKVLNNYRPISNLPFLDKVLERCYN